MMSNMKNEDKLNTVEQILETARYLFVKKGYFNTTIPDIVKKSGVSIGSIYHYFESKQQLAGVLYENTTNTCISMLTKRMEKAKTLKEKLKSVIDHLYFLADNEIVRIHYIFFLNHNEINSPDEPACPSKMFIIVQDMIEEGIKMGIFKNTRSDILAAAYLGIPMNIIKQKILNITDFTLSEYADVTFQMCWNAIIA